MGNKQFSPFARYFFAIFNDNIYWAQEKAGRTGNKVANSALTNWVFFFGVPDILLTCKYSRLTVSNFSQFRDERHMTSQTAIPLPIEV